MENTASMSGKPIRQLSQVPVVRWRGPLIRLDGGPASNVGRSLGGVHLPRGRTEVPEVEDVHLSLVRRSRSTARESCVRGAGEADYKPVRRGGHGCIASIDAPYGGPQD